MRMPISLNEKSVPSNKSSRNGFKKFLNGLKENWETRKKNAKKTISNNNAANEKHIIDILESIDFSQSRLDQEWIDFKTFSSQKYGDLEKTKKDIVNSIVSNNNYTDLNLKEYDTKLYEIAVEFRNAISNGHKNAAFAAKAALNIAVKDIRNQLEFIPQQWRRDYLNECTDYLDKWIQLIQNSVSLDATEISLENSDRALTNKLEEIDEKKKKYIEELEGNRTTKAALWKVRNQPVGQTLKNRTLKKIFDEITDFDISERMANFGIHMNNMQKRKNQMYAVEVEALRKDVENLPIPNDPLSFQKFQNSVKNMIAEINKIDEQYEEFLKFMYDLDGVLEGLENTQATKMQQQIVFKRIDEMVNAINEINNGNSIDNMSVRELNEKLGIKEKEENTNENTNENVEQQDEEENEVNLN